MSTTSVSLYGNEAASSNGLVVGVNGGVQFQQINRIQFTGTDVSGITNPSAGIALVSLNSSSSGGGGITAPFILFVGSGTASANQTFQDVGLLVYGSNPNLLVVSVNGVIITPVVSYTLSNNVLTILDYLEANAIIQCEPASAGSGGGGRSGGNAPFDFGTYAMPVSFTLDFGSYI